MNWLFFINNVYLNAFNVLRVLDVGDFEAQIFNFAQKLIGRTIAELCSFAPLLQNP